MRSSLFIICVAVAGCARPSQRVCAPVESWSAPAYACHPPAPAVVEVQPPAEPPAPARPSAQVSGEKIELSEVVQFETDKAVIRDESKPILNAVVEVLRDHREIERVRVEGHTDNRGTNEHNLTLSRERARSVKEYLVAQGVDARRLVTEGYGETRPVADNGTDEGRYKNRRVDFVIVKRTR